MKIWLSSGQIWPEMLAIVKQFDSKTIYGKIMVKDLHGQV